MADYKMTYNVDLVFLIDATASMDGILRMVKDNAKNFHRNLASAMEAKRKRIDRLRVRLVAFRDYRYDGDDAMMTTDFFTLPRDNDLFKLCIDGIQAFGGGDDPEDGLEALAYAIRSPWDTEGVKRRAVIVLWTDASTHDMGTGASEKCYPRDMARSFGELSEWWGDVQQSGFIDQNAKRLLLFAPDLPYWSTISDNWDNVLHFPSIAGQGLREYDYAAILNAICNSI